MAAHRVYRAAIRLYPREFRDRYGDDLLQAHADLTLEHGRFRAGMRTALDAAVTVPRYRLETIMSTRLTDAGILAVISALLVLAALATLDVGALLAAPAVLIAAIVAVTQRSRLARSLRAANGDRRRRRLRTAAVLGGICVVTLAVFVIDIGNDDSWGGRAIVYINIFNIAFVAAMVYLVAGLATRRPSTGTLMPPS